MQQKAAYLSRDKQKKKSKTVHIQLINAVGLRYNKPLANQAKKKVRTGNTAETNIRDKNLAKKGKASVQGAGKSGFKEKSRKQSAITPTKIEY